ncbi:galactose-3-O-sulfotransferase 2-like [Babylonia areolata]|uniref:galactose-3-O-sulfotransferase 2-like n=1 Tax=Babylonia areolata TaxID=304850 RepID=UPI003FD0A37C
MVSLRHLKIFVIVACVTVMAFIVLYQGFFETWNQGWKKLANTTPAEQGLTTSLHGNATALQRKTNPTQVSQETHHLFFLKVHKAASTTVLNVIYRFALKRHLLVLLPRRGNNLHQHSKNWQSNALPLPPGADHFDVLCNHLIFEEKSVRRSLPKDAFFVGIVREPFDQFLSAFKYYREKYSIGYLKRIPGWWPDNVHEYLKKPWFWEIGPTGSFTNNRMSVDFGMEPHGLRDAAYAKSYISYLNSTFHFVMVSNRFDESLILLRRLLGWKIQDVIYMRNNAFGGKRKIQNFTDLERQAHRKFNLADYELYEHFSRVLDDKIRAAVDNFQAEVKAFSVVLNSVQEYCLAPRGPDGAVKIVAEFWGEEFLLTSQMCDLMTLREIFFVKRMRKANEEVTGQMVSGSGE